MENTGDPTGRNIRERRNILGLSQTELGKLSGLTVQAINRIEVGERQPRRANLQAIAKALSCSPEDLHQAKSPAVRTTFDDAISLLEAYKNAESDIQSLAMALLSGDAQHLSDPKVRRAFEALKKVLEQDV